MVFVKFCFGSTLYFFKSLKPEIGVHSHLGRVFQLPTLPIRPSKRLFEIDLDWNLKTFAWPDVK
jgi:hypothetical protein